MASTIGTFWAGMVSWTLAFRIVRFNDVLKSDYFIHQFATETRGQRRSTRPRSTTTMDANIDTTVESDLQQVPDRDHLTHLPVETIIKIFSHIPQDSTSPSHMYQPGSDLPCDRTLPLSTTKLYESSSHSQPHSLNPSSLAAG